MWREKGGVGQWYEARRTGRAVCGGRGWGQKGISEWVGDRERGMDCPLRRVNDRF